MQLQTIVDTILQPKSTIIKGKITIPTQSGFEIIILENLIYAKADDNYTELYLGNHKKKLVSKTLKYFETILEDKDFVQIHKSYLVNVVP